MSKERYVTFEVAKHLKEKVLNPKHKGLDDGLMCMYDENGVIHWGIYSSDWYWRITQQMACDWLREEKSVWVTHRPLDYDCGVDGLAYIKTPDNEWLCAYTCTKDSVEEAIETALEYVLTNLI